MEQDGIAVLGELNVPALVVGAAFLLAGWALYWLSLNAAGAVLGGGLALLLAEVLGPLASLSDDEMFGVRIAAVVIGLVAGIFVARTFHKVAFFSAGLALGAIAWYVAVTRLRAAGLAPDWMEEPLALIAGIPIAGVVAGLVAVLADRLVIAMVTAVVGSVLVMIGVNWQWGSWPAIPLALVGFLFQAGLSSKRRKKDEEEDDEE